MVFCLCFVANVETLLKRVKMAIAFEPQMNADYFEDMATAKTIRKFLISEI